MGVKKNNIKKIISYLLIFTVLLGFVQLGNMQIVKAEGDRTFIDEVIIKADSKTLTVDKVSGDYICEPINMGTKSFTIEGKTNYKVTSVTSSGNMSVVVGGTLQAPKYIFSSIKDYSEFYFTINVDAPDGSGGTASKTYVVKMKFDTESMFQFDNIRLTYIDSKNSTSTASIGYSEKSADGYYRNSVEEDIIKAKVELISGSYVMTTGVTVNGSSNNTVNLTGGDNIINITITRSNTSRQYNLIINKKGQPLLKSLVPSAGSLTPAFDTDVFDYTISVPTTQTTIAFTPTSVDNSSTIKVGKNVVKSGKKSSEITLSEGTNKIPILVTTKEGESSTYMVNVVRTEKFRSAKLSSLTLSGGTLNPAFNKEIYEYTATVENNVSSITVTAKAEDATATILINDKKIPSGAASGYINLNEGGNIITVKVTDTNGNTNSYTINVTRKYSKNNVNLSSITVTDGTLSPKFDPEIYNYSVKVARNIEKVRVLFTLQNDKSKVKINGKEYKAGQQSDYVKLDIGANLVVVEVTAEDNKSTTTYKLSIIRGDIEGTNQWVLVAGEWTFYNAAGIQIKNQWVKYDNQWYFLDVNGHMKKGWILESGNWYYLNKDGIMQTGWFYDKGYWYYLQGDGSMRTNIWATYDGKWYFFNNFGELQTGWTLYLGKWYFMDDHGVMQKGWITYDKNKYYINDDGTMKTGWLYSGKVWYYLEPSGKMVRGWQTIDGKKYYFDASGAMKTGMMFLDGQWINLNNA